MSDREEHKGNIRRNKAKKQIESDLNNYNEWMKKGGMYVNLSVLSPSLLSNHLKMC